MEHVEDINVTYKLLKMQERAKKAEEVMKETYLFGNGTVTKGSLTVLYDKMWGTYDSKKEKEIAKKKIGLRPGCVFCKPKRLDVLAERLFIDGQFERQGTSFYLTTEKMRGLLSLCTTELAAGSLPRYGIMNTSFEIKANGEEIKYIINNGDTGRIYTKDVFLDSEVGEKKTFETTEEAYKILTDILG